MYLRVQSIYAMEVEITFRGEVEEIENDIGIPISDLRLIDEQDGAEDELDQEEKLVLQTVRDNPGRALRTIHKEAAKLDASPWEFTGEWDDDRTAIRSILRDLKRDDLVRLDDRSYYPADHEKVAESEE